ncbi:uncharacterized protein LY79DRAFT_661558 [Colletotrichum navitas]|uniref:Transmembrane protein n=1 Tax=Colletotrichum navitas TaxID=681940 RepID=A0AAD8PSD8_9PEZI|nr:uncharacterized protein LY79DRAFT_661558 [Colletotrichum navitas]KAK1579858.1 hypothetical protein LY79DRAFT_661558 [Colletotrichum navitas]
MMSSHFSPVSDPARPSETGPDSRVKVPVNTSSTFVASLGSLALLFVALAASYLRPLLAPFRERISGFLFAPAPPAMPVVSSSPRQQQNRASRPSITAPSSPSLGKSSQDFCARFTAPVPPFCTPPRLSPRAFTLSMSHYMGSLPRRSPSLSCSSAPSPSVSVVSSHCLHDPFVDSASPPSPVPNFDQLMAFADKQIDKAREARLRQPRSFSSCSSAFSVSGSLASPSLSVSAPVSSSAHVSPSSPVVCVSSDCSLISVPSCTPSPREMDTIDRSVERMRLRAIELDRDCDLKLAQLKALVASGIPTKPSADKSHDYSTDSPTPHTISNWDSTLEEDRLSSYSFTHMPTPSARIPAALAEWDTSSASTPVASVSSPSVLSISSPSLHPVVPSSCSPVPSTPVASVHPLSMSPDPVLRKFARNVTKAHFAARGEELPPSWTPPSFAHGRISLVPCCGRVIVLPSLFIRLSPFSPSRRGTDRKCSFPINDCKESQKITVVAKLEARENRTKAAAGIRDYNLQ